MNGAFLARHKKHLSADLSGKFRSEILTAWFQTKNASRRARIAEDDGDLCEDGSTGSPAASRGAGECRAYDATAGGRGDKEKEIVTWSDHWW